MITKLDSVTLDALLQEQNPFGSGKGKFDLKNVQLITPAALTQLAAALYSYDGIRRFRLPMEDSPAAAPSVPKSRRKATVGAET